MSSVIDTMDAAGADPAHGVAPTMNSMHATGPRPATPRRETIPRNRLIGVLARRFDLRLIVLEGGAGFGKTTLLGQAIADNDREPRGRDVWIDVERFGASSLATLTLAALGVSGVADPGIDHVVDAVWDAAPAQVALHFDNLHRLEPSVARAFFEPLLDRLPNNGHLVLSSRVESPVAFRRLLAEGRAVRIDEVDLAFDASELEAFATSRGIDAASLGQAAWPALLELQATDRRSARAYVEEEVLAHIATERLDALRRLAILGWFDDELVDAVGDYPGTAEELADGLPLISRSPDGAMVLHDLWPSWLPSLPAPSHRAAASAIGLVLERRGELSAAFEMFVEANDQQHAERILRRFACDYSTQHTLSERRRLLELATPDMRELPAVHLIEADLTAVSQPTSSAAPLARAMASAEAANDHELIAQNIVRQGERVYRTSDQSELRELDALLVALDSDNQAVAAVRQLIDIWLAMATNRTADVIAHVNRPAALAYEPTSAHALSYAALAVGHHGNAEQALAELERLPPLGGRHAAILGGFASIMRFFAGRMDAERRRDVRALVERIRNTGDTHTLASGASTVAIYHFAAGELDTANALLSLAESTAAAIDETSWGLTGIRLASAWKHLIEGDEDAAAALINQALPPGGPFDGYTRHLFNLCGVGTYLLAPQVRHHFDDDDCGPSFRLGRQAGQALAALREEGSFEPAAALPWTSLHRLRTWLPEPWLVELALAATCADDPPPVDAIEAALASATNDPHRTLLAIADRYGGAIGQLAAKRARLTPQLPDRAVHVCVLGPTSIEIAGGSGPTDDIRTRVLHLLHALIDHTRLSRSRICDLLWPDLDETKARNNLRVTLSHLLSLLEPDRPRGAPAWHIRTDDDMIELVRSPQLILDIDKFDEHLADARRCDADGLPTAALDHWLQAVELYRGDYLLESTVLDIGFEARTRARLDFVEAAVRSSSLLGAIGELQRAIALARRAIDAEPIAEGGHAALLRALRDDGDRTAHAAAASNCQQLFEAEQLTPTASLRELFDFDVVVSIVA